MKILEFFEYNKYLNNKDFMLYLNNIKKKLNELYPKINFKLELIIDQIYCLYYEEYNIDDAINKLYLNGLLFKFYSSFDGN